MRAPIVNNEAITWGTPQARWVLFATVLGSGIWCAVLCYVGIKMGEDEKLMKGELHRISIWLGGGMLGLGALYYFFVHRHMKKAMPKW